MIISARDNFLDNGYLRSRIVVMEKVYLLLGTNIGDLEENLKLAIEAISSRNIKIKKKSKIYKTKPWGLSDQPDYLNLALEVESDLTAGHLLDIFKDIEREMGRREARARWQPRVIDIDILFWGDHIVETPDLKIPHKEFFNRPFALKILTEIAPDFVPPHTGKTLQEISIGESDEGIEIYRD
jgi:2-amino-4-hydroxy-6-hydroxymethyldihydropteridine diphosphokinase